MRSQAGEGAAAGPPRWCTARTRHTVLSQPHSCRTRDGRPQDCLNILRGDAFFKRLDERFLFVDYELRQIAQGSDADELVLAQLAHSFGPGLECCIYEGCMPQVLAPILLLGVLLALALCGDSGYQVRQPLGYGVMPPGETWVTVDSAYQSPARHHVTWCTSIQRRFAETKLLSRCSSQPTIT